MTYRVLSKGASSGDTGLEWSLTLTDPRARMVSLVVDQPTWAGVRLGDFVVVQLDVVGHAPKPANLQTDPPTRDVP